MEKQIKFQVLYNLKNIEMDNSQHSDILQLYQVLQKVTLNFKHNLTTEKAGKNTILKTSCFLLKESQRITLPKKIHKNISIFQIEHELPIQKFPKMQIFDRVGFTTNNNYQITSSSKLFYIGKLSRIFNPLQYPPSILYMRIVILYPRIKNVRQTVLPHKDVRQNSYAFENRVASVLVAPHKFQAEDRIDFPFQFLDMVQQIRNSQFMLQQDGSYKTTILFYIFLDKTKDSFAIIFGDIFSLIFVVERLLRRQRLILYFDKTMRLNLHYFIPLLTLFLILLQFYLTFHRFFLNKVVHFLRQRLTKLLLYYYFSLNPFLIAKVKLRERIVILILSWRQQVGFFNQKSIEMQFKCKSRLQQFDLSRKLLHNYLRLLCLKMRRRGRRVIYSRIRFKHSTNQIKFVDYLLTHNYILIINLRTNISCTYWHSMHDIQHQILIIKIVIINLADGLALPQEEPPQTNTIRYQSIYTRRSGKQNINYAVQKVQQPASQLYGPHLFNGQYWKVDKQRFEKGAWKKQLQSVSELTPRYLQMHRTQTPELTQIISKISFPNLVSLYLSKNQICSIQMLYRLEAPNLIDLDLRTNHITSIRALRKCSFRLDHLFLQNNPIIDLSGLSAINFHQKIKRTYVTKFSDSDRYGKYFQINLTNVSELAKIEIPQRIVIRGQYYPNIYNLGNHLLQFILPSIYRRSCWRRDINYPEP